MNLPEASASANAGPENFTQMRSCWVCFLILGVIAMVAGFLAIGSAFIATIASMLLLGIFLMCGGVAQIINAFLVRSWEGFFIHFLAGLLHIIIGALLIEHPLGAAAGVTLMLAAAFMVGGTLRVVFALTKSFAGRGWVLLNGVITLLLGVMIWRQWPESSIWVIGLFVGIELILSGWSWVMLSLVVKGAAAPEPKPVA